MEAIAAVLPQDEHVVSESFTTCVVSGYWSSFKTSLPMLREMMACAAGRGADAVVLTNSVRAVYSLVLFELDLIIRRGMHVLYTCYTRVICVLYMWYTRVMHVVCTVRHWLRERLETDGVKAVWFYNCWVEWT